MFRDLNRKAPKGLADILLPFALVGDGELLQNDGSLIAGWKYAGPDMETATFSQMASLADRLNEVLRLGSGWMVQANSFRMEASDYPDGTHFPDPVTRMIDDERRQQNQQAGARFESEYFLTLTYLPPHKNEHMVRRFLYGARGEGAASRALTVFREAVDRFENVFDNLFRIERLKSRTVEQPGGFITKYDDLLGYFRRCLDGENTPFVLPKIPAYLGDILACGDFDAGLQPRIQNKHIAVVNIDGFPTQGHPGMLNVLDSLGMAYRWSTRGILLSEDQAVKAFKDIRRGYAAAQRGLGEKTGMTETGEVDLYAVKCAAEVDEMILSAKTGLVQACLYSSAIVILHEDSRRLTELAREAQKAIQCAGFSARVERENATEAWRGTLPGDGYADVRRVYMTTNNLSELMPIASIWSGRKENPSSLLPKGTPPLLTGVTTGSSQFRLHLHVSDVAHGFMSGPTGAGKSTALGLIGAQWFRIPKARVVALDYGRSMWALTKAVSGEFYHPGSMGDSGFCPLRNLGQHGELAWAAEWLEVLCELHDEPLSAVQKNRLAEGLRKVAQSPEEERTLTHVRAHIQDEHIRTVLTAFVGSGPLAYLLDAEHQSMRTNGRFTCIEMEHLMGLGDKVLVPIMLLIFHEIERSLDGSPTLLIVDEAWVALSHPLFRERIEKWLLTMRKKNCAVLFATQQLSKIMKSEIADVVMANCPTKIYLANPDAASSGIDGHSGSREFYAAAGLNEREIEAIRLATPKRDYFITSPEGRRMVSLDIGEAGLAFCGINGEEDRESLSRVMASSGDRWQVEWLKKRKVAAWPEYLAELMALYERKNSAPKGQLEEEIAVYAY